MPNQDGFEPGQDVSFSEIVLLNKKPASQDEDESPEAITRDSIAAMKKGDVRELLEAHGASTEGGVAEMRERLVEVMFVEA